MAIKVTITFMSGNQKITRSDIPPTVKEGILYVKNQGGEEAGGCFAPMRNVRLVEVTPIKESADERS